MSEKENTLSVLIVYLSKEAANDLGLFLGGIGFKVSIVHSEKEATGQLVAYEFNAILLSVILPDGNGLEISRRIKRDPITSKIPVILSGTFPKNSRFALEAKSKYLADCYLEEPVSMPELQSVLEKFTGKPVDRRAAAAATKNLENERAKKKEIEKRKAKEVAKSSGGQNATKNTRRKQKQITVPLEGALGNVLFPELILHLYQTRSTGSLQLKVLSEERQIFFNDGIPVSIQTNFILEESLGQLLLRKQKINEQQLKACLSESKSSNTRLGDVFVSRGFLTKGDLNNFLKRQARFKMVSAFKWNEGTYRFLNGRPEHPEAINLHSDILKILLTGVNRHLSMSKLEKRIFENKNRIIRRNQIDMINPIDLGLSRRQWALLSMVDGQQTVGNIIAQSQLNFNQTFQTLYLYFLFGLISFADKGPMIFKISEPVLSRVLTESRTIGGTEMSELDNQKEIPESGDISQFSLPLIFYRLFVNSETGVLSVNYLDSTELTVFREGQIIKIETVNGEGLFLGEILVQQGILSSSQRDQMLEEALASSTPLGESLIKKGLVSPHQIFEMLSMQIENKLKSLFMLQEGNFSFERLTSAELVAEMSFKIDIPKLAVNAQKRLVDASALERDIIKYKDFIIERTNDGNRYLDGIFSDSDEIKMVRLINGRHTLSYILERSPLNHSKSLKIVFALTALNLAAFLQD